MERPLLEIPHFENDVATMIFFVCVKRHQKRVRVFNSGSCWYWSWPPFSSPNYYSRFFSVGHPVAGGWPLDGSRKNFLWLQNKKKKQKLAQPWEPSEWPITSKSPLLMAWPRKETPPVEDFDNEGRRNKSNLFGRRPAFPGLFTGFYHIEAERERGTS